MQQTLPSDQFEIIVADNNSNCGVSAVEAAIGNHAKVVPAPVQGAGEARNCGVSVSRGRYLAFLDSDCRPCRDWLEIGLTALATADMVGGRIDVEVDDQQNLTATEAFELVFGFNNASYLRKGFSSTANMFLPRAVFERVGGFRSRVAEDKDWGQRATALGFRWKYVREGRITHPARRDWEELRIKWKRLIRESYLLAKERPLGNIGWFLRTLVVLISPILQIPKIICSRKLQRWGDKLKAIYILVRLRCWRFTESYKAPFDL
jgi:glycosyltransferase involved in cell wall biosynthesis